MSWRVWGARSLGPPTSEMALLPGWLRNALDNVLAPLAPDGRFAFRVGDEVASLVDGEVVPELVDEPDVLIEATPDGIYDLFVEQRPDHVTVTGDLDLLDQLLAAAPARAAG